MSYYTTPMSFTQYRTVDRFLLSRFQVWTPLLASARNGDLIGLQQHWNAEENITAWVIAAYFGQLHCIQWLHQHKCGCLTMRTIMGTMYKVGFGAASSGHLNCLQYAYDNMDSNEFMCNIMMELAMRNGHLNCVRFIHERGGLRSLFNMGEFAARTGQLHCIQYIYEHGESLFGVCEHAAKNGHLNCLQYAHERGGTLPSLQAVLTLIQRNHVECLRYLITNQYILHANLNTYLTYEQKHNQCGQYLIEHGYIKPTVVQVDSGDIQLVMDQAHCTYDAAKIALQNNGNDIVNATLELTI